MRACEVNVFAFGLRVAHVYGRVGFCALLLVAVLGLQGCQSPGEVPLPSNDEGPQTVSPRATPSEILSRIRELKSRWDKDPIPVGLRRQTFYDDVIISRKKGTIIRTVGEVAKLNSGNPVLEADRPWETRDYKMGVGPFLSVIRSQSGKFMMWYGTGLYFGRGGTVEIGYAESDDGLKWVKPAGVFRRDNIVQTKAVGAGVYEDGHDPRADHRFKMVFGSYDQPYTNIIADQGVMLAHSADGKSWRNYSSAYFISDCKSDTANSLYWDEDLQAYRLITRILDGNSHRGAKEYAISWLQDAGIGRPALKADWTVVQRTRLPPEKGEIYCFYVQKYWDLYLAYVTVFHDNYNRFFVSVSRDGVTWNFDLVRRGNDLLSLGPPGYFDELSILPPISAFITVGDKHWIYYGGSRGKHVDPPLASSSEPPMYAIGLAEVRQDGFFYMKMNGFGFLETRLFEWSGVQLEVNCNSSRGKLWVEIMDEHGNPIHGFSANDADVNTCDEVHHVVSWKGLRDLSELRHRVVRLRFYYEGNVNLYAFQALDDAP